YLYGNAERLSPDAPVPVLHYQREDARLGGAGRVASYVGTLGAAVRVVSILGQDDAAAQIRRMLEDCGADTSGILELPSRPSTSKLRLVGLAQHRHAQQMIRLDYEDTSAVIGEAAEKLIAAFDAAID